MNDTPWSRALTVLQWGKWGLGALALNAANAAIEVVFWAAVALIAFAVIADRLRTRHLERRWADHCQEIADQWAARPSASVTPLPDPIQQAKRRRAA